MEKVYKIGEFAALTGRSPQTLRDWDMSGQLPARRTPTNHRYYIETDIEKAIGLQKSVARISDRPSVEVLRSKLQQVIDLAKEIQSELDLNTW